MKNYFYNNEDCYLVENERFYNGKVADVRNYDVEKAINENKSILVQCRQTGKELFINPNRLKNPDRVSKKEWNTQFEESPNKTYKLYSYYV